MGNIINPTPGDLVDRQTILQIKIAKCGVVSDTGIQPVSQEITSFSSEAAMSRTKLLEKTEVNIQPLVIEHEAIQQKLERDFFPKLDAFGASAFDPLLEKLLNINKTLWKLEDQARVLRSAPDKQLQTVLERKAECLDVISTSNDMRLGVVKQINALWGIQSEEKIYS